jgi:arabinose-5-phosphate isomerase
MKKDSDNNTVRERILRTLDAESKAVSGLRDALDEDFFHALQVIQSRTGKIVVTGVGKSGFIAMKMVATLVSLGKDAVYLNPLDALHGDSGIIRDGDVLVLFSFSGGSQELIRLVKHFRKHFSIHTVTVTGKRHAPLTEFSDGVITFTIDGEGCPIGLAPMASTTASLVIADCIASALTSPEEFKPEHFAKYHPAGTLGLSLTPVHEVMRVGENIPKILAHESFEDALRVITLQKLVQIVGIVDDAGRLIGAFSDGDIRRKILETGDLRGKTIGEIMNPNPRYIHHEDTLHTALSYMRENKVNSLFVTDQDRRYVGFIHLHDIIDQ